MVYFIDSPMDTFYICPVCIPSRKPKYFPQFILFVSVYMVFMPFCEINFWCSNTNCIIFFYHTKQVFNKVWGNDGIVINNHYVVCSVVECITHTNIIASGEPFIFFTSDYMNILSFFWFL